MSAVKEVVRHSELPLVSVIIPSYNHARFLPDAIESIQKQTYPNTEIIVVDDGSTDNTKEVLSRYPKLKYVYQKNQGLSAARNTGVKNSSAAYLIFADADDLLYHHAIAYNMDLLLANSNAAFVSGGYDLLDLDVNRMKRIGREVTSDHYLHFLQGNYVGMHGTVLYRRWVFDEFQFDVSLKACEDYDLYLNVSRKYPVIHHQEALACYRMHASNMSGNATLMLSSALNVLMRQEAQVITAAEKDALQEGEKSWVNYYGPLVYCQIRDSNKSAAAESVSILKKYKPKLFYRFLIA
ncbi:MAG: glycosyltransferase, partial [Chitinophagaceae bacterium]